MQVRATNNYNVTNNSFLFASGPVPSYGKYTTPEFSGKIPKKGTPPHRGFITEDIHAQTTKLLNLAAGIAHAVKAPVQNVQDYTSHASGHRRRACSSSVPMVNLDFSDRSTRLFSPTTVNQTIVQNGNNNRVDTNKKEEKDHTVALVIAGITGLCAIVGGAILLGKAKAKNENLDHKINQFSKLVGKWEFNRQAYAYSPEYEYRMTKVITLAEGIMLRNQKNILGSISKIALPLIAFGGIAVAGALLGSVVLATVGALGLVGVGAYALYKSIHNANSQVDKTAADKILKNLRKIEENTDYQGVTRFFPAHRILVETVTTTTTTTTDTRSDWVEG